MFALLEPVLADEVGTIGTKGWSAIEMPLKFHVSNDRRFLVLSLLFYLSSGYVEVRIEPYTAHHLNAVIQLSLRAWAPVFESIQNAMDADLYQAFYPDHWRVSQQQAIEEVCAAEDTHVWVAKVFDQAAIEDAGLTVGFIAVKLHLEDKMGEIYMIAVDPDVQGQGIGTALIEFAIAWMKEAGMSIAMVETGGDPGHAPARHTYEKAGFGLWKVARYFKKL